MTALTLFFWLLFGWFASPPVPGPDGDPDIPQIVQEPHGDLGNDSDPDDVGGRVEGPLRSTDR